MPYLHYGHNTRQQVPQANIRINMCGHPGRPFCYSSRTFQKGQIYLGLENGHLFYKPDKANIKILNFKTGKRNVCAFMSIDMNATLQ